MTLKETLFNTLTGYYGRDGGAVLDWMFRHREVVAEKLYNDPNGAATWAHDIMSLEKQWS